MATEMKALEITGLKKSFRSNFLLKTYRVLKDISIQAEKGEIYGLLGPNGAGKTTTIKCIIGLIFPDAGQILINGRPSTALEIRRLTGFLPENPYFYDYLTAGEFLYFTGTLFALPARIIRQRSRELMERVGLAGQEKLKLRKFSKGMIQRIGLAQALMQDPDFLILDEPFSGLDPIGRKELREIIQSLKERGKTIFFSSHILQDVEMMADRVGIILNGRTIREGKLSELISHSVRYYEIVCDRIQEKKLAAIHPGAIQRNSQFIITVEEEARINPVMASIIRLGGRIQSLQPIKMTLEDIFINELREKR